MERPEVVVPKKSGVLSALFAQVLLCALAFSSGLLLSREIASEGLSLAAVRLSLSALLCAMASCVSASLNLCRRSLLWELGALLGFAAAAVFGFTFYALWVWVLYLVLSRVLIALVLKRTARIPCAGTLSAPLVLFLAGGMALSVRFLAGEGRPSRLVEFLQGRTTAFCEGIVAILREALGGEELAKLLTPDLASALSASVMLSLPGIALAISFFIAYSTTFALRFYLKRTDKLAILYPDGFHPTPSVVSAVVYGICLLVSALFSAEYSVFYAVFANLSSVLELLFFFTALSVLLRRRRKKEHRSYFGLIFTVVFAVVLLGGNLSLSGAILSALLPLFVSVFYPVLSFYGLFYTLFSAAKQHVDSQKGM